MQDLTRSHREHFLHPFLHPRSVAVVGASRNPMRINHNLVANLVKLGFPGRIFPVHPEAKEILGLRTVPSVEAIQEEVDLAVVAVPHLQTLDILRACARKGIRRVVIVAGGFSETGEAGRRMQSEMLQLLRNNGMRAIGPNALSPICVPSRFAVSFHPIREIRQGGLSLVFQSGLYEPRLDWLLTDFNLHLNKIIDLGNKMDVHEVDALSYLIRDPQTRVIGIHLESIEGEGRDFLEVLGRARGQKPIVVLKSGRTREGARAAASHTGVMVQENDLLFDAALRQHGALRAQNLEEFFHWSRALERFGPLRLAGQRVLLATLPGGEGVIVTDLVEMQGMKLARPTKETHNALRPIFPPWEISANPFDLGVCLQFHDPLKVYGLLIESAAKDPQVDALAIQLPRWAARILPKEAFRIFAAAPASGKPLVLWVPGTFSGQVEALQWLEERNVPVFPCPEKAIQALAVLHRFTASGPTRPMGDG